MSELTATEAEHLNVYRNVLSSLVMQHGGEMLVKLIDLQPSIMWKIEDIDGETCIRLRVDIEDNIIPMSKAGGN
jgi:hypothetical protein